MKIYLIPDFLIVFRRGKYQNFCLLKLAKEKYVFKKSASSVIGLYFQTVQCTVRRTTSTSTHAKFLVDLRSTALSQLGLADYINMAIWLFVALACHLTAGQFAHFETRVKVNVTFLIFVSPNFNTPFVCSFRLCLYFVSIILCCFLLACGQSHVYLHISFTILVFKYKYSKLQ